MPSLIKKKTRHESKGFVRRMLQKGASFKSLNNGCGESLIDSSSGSQSFGRITGSEGSKWRPRKNQFELLDGDEDDDSLSAAFQLENSFSSSWLGIQKISTFPSTESESGDYRRDIMFEKKATALMKRTPSKNNDNNNSRKREFSPIKPSGKDTSILRGTSCSTKETPSKKHTEELEWGNGNHADAINFSDNNATAASEDPFFNTMSGSSATDSFGFQINSNDGKSNKDIAIKSPSVPRNDEQLSTSRQTSVSTKNRKSSYNTVASDPTDFFSKEQTTKLTMNNLAKMGSSLHNTNNTNAEKGSAMDGMERMVKKNKFYQFTIDEDKASTVVESTLQLPADYPYGDKNYDIDDDQTEFSCSQTSQGTKIQQRSKTNEKTTETFETAYDILSTSSDARKNPAEVKAFDAFFPNHNSDEGKEFDACFPSSTKKDDFFPGFSGNQQETRHKLATESDISSSWGDAYFERSYKSSTEFGGSSQTERGRREERHLQQASIKSLSSHQVSAKSLSYSPSPVHKKKSDVIPQNGRQPLTMKNTRSSGGKNDAFPSAKKVVQGNSWIRSESTREREFELQFGDLVAQPPSKKRNSSIGSSNIQLPPSDHFDSLSRRASAKENLAVKSNRHEDVDGDWRAYQKNQFPLRRNDEEEDDDDDDSFDDIGLWEKPSSFGNGISRIQSKPSGNNRLRLSRNDHSSYNRPSRNQYIDDDHVDDDNRSTGGFSLGKVSRASRSSGASYTKPLALPSNAIAASMLFRTHYDIDQNDVEEKINRFEKENSKQREIRHLHGDIPDDVHADSDLMTTVSSFSDATSAYFQESWRKPSRDLVSHLTSARVLDMDYPSARRLPIRQASHVEQEQVGLYEA